jgi:uncharacterized LabA/DUF88 family protein
MTSTTLVTSKKQVAIMIDGGFAEHRLYKILGDRHPTPQQLWDFACACATGGEEIFRIYYYDCPPFEGARTHPLTGRSVDFAKSDVFRRKCTLHEEFARMDLVAFRAGHLNCDGWKLKKTAIARARKATAAGGTYTLQADDLAPDIKQKQVDMKIGLDIAWLASKRIVERLVLVAGDADFTPAMKFARREGIQVVLVTLGGMFRPELRAHADQFREVHWAPSPP